jgi:hypothetical protein
MPAKAGIQYSVSAVDFTMRDAAYWIARSQRAIAHKAGR